MIVFNHNQQNKEEFEQILILSYQDLPTLQA